MGEEDGALVVDSLLQTVAAVVAADIELPSTVILSDRNDIGYTVVGHRPDIMLFVLDDRVYARPIKAGSHIEELDELSLRIMYQKS